MTAKVVAAAGVLLLATIGFIPGAQASHGGGPNWCLVVNGGFSCEIHISCGTGPCDYIALAVAEGEGWTGAQIAFSSAGTTQTFYCSGPITCSVKRVIVAPTGDSVVTCMRPQIGIAAVIPFLGEINCLVDAYGHDGAWGECNETGHRWVAGLDDSMQPISCSPGDMVCPSGGGPCDFKVVAHATGDGAVHLMYAGFTIHQCQEVIWTCNLDLIETVPENSILVPACIVQAETHALFAQIGCSFLRF